MAFDFFVEDSSGTLVTDPICAAFSTTTNSSGVWSVNISAVGFTHIHSVNVTAKSPDNTNANSYTATLSSVSTTSVGGYVFKPNAILIGGSPIQSAGNNVTVYVTVIGDLA